MTAQTTSTVWRPAKCLHATDCSLSRNHFRMSAYIRPWEIRTRGKARRGNTLDFLYPVAINEEGGLEMVAFGWTDNELKDLVTVGKQFGIESPRVAISVFNNELRFDDVADVP